MKGTRLDLSSVYLKEFIKFRKLTALKLAKATDIKKRTIEGYTQGKPAFKNAVAINFLKISDFLDVDPRYLAGLEKWKLSNYFNDIVETLKARKDKTAEVVEEITRARNFRMRQEVYEALEKLQDEAESVEKEMTIDGIVKITFPDKSTIKTELTVGNNTWEKLVPLTYDKDGMPEIGGEGFDIAVRRRISIEDITRIEQFLDTVEDMGLLK